MDSFQDTPLLFSSIVALGAAALAAYLVFRHVLLTKWFARISKLTREVEIPYELCNAPLRFLFPPLFLLIALPIFELPITLRKPLTHLLSIWAVIGVSWLIVRILAIVKAVILSRYEVAARDNLKARRINTQLDVIHRIINFLIILIAISLILMTFEKIRQIGLSMLASAGIAGIIIGFAAQRSLANLIAGIQIALAQPIRIDDVVIVENEWGWIEEITLTYVVVRIWDQRRLILPITYFIERPFQNWTRQSAELLGTVFIHVDYRTPVDELRRQLGKIVADSPLWDKRVAKIQVTNATDRTM